LTFRILSDYRNTGLKWHPKQDAHSLEVCVIKFNRTQQILSHQPRNSREPCHQLVSSDGDRQRARVFYQMDQRGYIRLKGRTAGHEHNRDEGSYQLSLAYDRFLDTASSRRVKNWKN